MMLKILTVIGARPQFVKAAPLSKKITLSEKINEIIVHTGQHYDPNMSSVFFNELSLPNPHYNLNINGGSHSIMTAQMLIKIEEILLFECPDAVLVYGDTNSTLSGALAASKLKIPIIHVEAGLRSFNKDMPEEINRILTDHMSTLLFCPTKQSVINLKNENILSEMHFVGDLMYDIFLLSLKYLVKPEKIIPDLKYQEYALMTLHREANVDCEKKLCKLIGYAVDFSIANKLKLIFPVHPRTRKLLKNININHKSMHYIEPVSYVNMQSLVRGAKFVLTDSGGLQKEACFHGVLCITLRDETEWVETINNGWNRLWINNEYLQPPVKCIEYGNGNSAQDILDIILKTFGK